MSFVPEFAPDTKSQWRDLDSLVQELVLDDLESLAAHPPGPRIVTLRPDFIHDVGDVRHHVFLRCVVDHPNRRITVVGLVHVQTSPGQRPRVSNSLGSLLCAIITA